MANRLSDARSVYLRQHADNPVDWFPWGSEAFDHARRRRVPILLSVGYASCHWCHVMARESFQNPRIAETINRDFVAIKVDREERPDVDAIYMSAAQALTGSGGWPLTVFLTPDGKPFFAGTYFPPEPAAGLASFPQVLAAVTDAWRNDEGRQATEAAERITAALVQQQASLPERISGMTQMPDLVDQACDTVLQQLDYTFGGFGGAPKFPPTMTLEFLLRHFERTGREAARDAAAMTLDRMARGGIYDQLAGGFSRYSVDSAWHVPHFEKMLDDNALLLRVYAHHGRLTSSRRSLEIAAEIGEFLLREMRDEHGAFITSLDAEAGGVEGGTYRWPRHELVAALRDACSASALPAGCATVDDAVGTALRLFGAGELDIAEPDHVSSAVMSAAAADPHGDVPQPDVILRMVGSPSDEQWFESVQAHLLAVRSRRPQPGRDEIVVLRSNALAIAALAEFGAAWGRPSWIDAANQAADTLIATHRTAHGWARSSLHGAVGDGPAGLADVAAFAQALLQLYQATGRVERLEAAIGLLREMIEHFRDADGWFDSADDAARTDGAPMIFRHRDPTDGAAPSGASAAAEALLTAAALADHTDFRELATETLVEAAALMDHAPRAAGWYLAVAEAALSGPLQIAIAGPPGQARDAWVQQARRHAPAGAVIDIGSGNEPGRPLLADRTGINGAPAAYLCRQFVCDAPVTSVDALQRALQAPAGHVG